jgi:hypothetical protein
VDALVGPVVVVNVVLVLAGAFKFVRPAPTAGALRALRVPSSIVLVRLLGIAEMVIGVAAAISIAPAWNALSGALYLGFAAFVVAALAADAPVQSCGCFGQVDTPPSPLHVVLDVAAACTLFAAAASQPPSLRTTLSDQPWSGVPFVLLLAITTYLCVAILTVLPLTSGSRAPA